MVGRFDVGIGGRAGAGIGGRFDENTQPVRGPLDQRTESGKTGCIRVACWKTKNKGNLSSGFRFLEDYA